MVQFKILSSAEGNRDKRSFFRFDGVVLVKFSVKLFGFEVDCGGTDILIFLDFEVVEGGLILFSFLFGVFGGKLSVVLLELISQTAKSSGLFPKINSKLAGLMYSLLTTWGQFGLLLECS